MSHPTLMEQVLTDLLAYLQNLHARSKNQAAKKQILRYIERIHEALADTPQQ